MSPIQKATYAHREVPPLDKGQVKDSCNRIFELLKNKVPSHQKIRIHSDNHPAYTRVLNQQKWTKIFEHRIYPNPQRGPKGSLRSLAARQRDAALFAVDAFHALWRHSQAHHRRETIAFARRTNALLERGYLLVVWKNLVQKCSERRPKRITPAMKLGLTDVLWSWHRIFAQRIFPFRLQLPDSWMKIYRREWITSALGYNAPHQLVNGF